MGGKRQVSEEEHRKRSEAARARWSNFHRNQAKGTVVTSAEAKKKRDYPREQASQALAEANHLRAALAGSALYKTLMQLRAEQHGDGVRGKVIAAQKQVRTAITAISTAGILIGGILDEADGKKAK